jgi:hypothetical protein
MCVSPPPLGRRSVLPLASPAEAAAATRFDEKGSGGKCQGMHSIWEAVCT